MTLAASLFQLPLCFLERLAASRFAAVRKGGCQLVQGVGEHFVFKSPRLSLQGRSAREAFRGSNPAVARHGKRRLWSPKATSLPSTHIARAEITTRPIPEAVDAGAIGGGAEIRCGHPFRSN